MAKGDDARFRGIQPGSGGVQTPKVFSAPIDKVPGIPTVWVETIRTNAVPAGRSAMHLVTAGQALGQIQKPVKSSLFALIKLYDSLAWSNTVPPAAILRALKRDARVHLGSIERELDGCLDKLRAEGKAAGDPSHDALVAFQHHVKNAASGPQAALDILLNYSLDDSSCLRQVLLIQRGATALARIAKLLENPLLDSVDQFLNTDNAFTAGSPPVLTQEPSCDAARSFLEKFLAQPPQTGHSSLLDALEDLKASHGHVLNLAKQAVKDPSKRPAFADAAASFQSSSESILSFLDRQIAEHEPLPAGGEDAGFDALLGLKHQVASNFLAPAYALLEGIEFLFINTPTNAGGLDKSIQRLEKAGLSFARCLKALRDPSQADLERLAARADGF